LKWVYGAGFAGPIVAEKKGFFRERGLDVRIESGGPAVDPIQTVAAGTDAFGITGADRLLQARQQGVPVVAIALENRQSFAGFLALTKSGIKSAADLRGKRIGIFHDDTYTVLQGLLRTVGIPQSAITEVPVGYDLAPLLEGMIDVYSCYVINQPPKLAAQNVAYVLIRPVDYGLDFAGNVYFTSESMIRQHPQQVQAFLDGVYAGWTYVFTHEAEAVDLVLQGDKSLDRQGEAGLLRALIPEIHRPDEKFLWIEPSYLAKTEEIMRDQQLLALPVDLNRAVDPTFVQHLYADKPHSPSAP
jgi:NitT/TauT family transport system substrate-binding protein